MKFNFDINSDIKCAETLPSNFYKSIEAFETVKEKIFLNSWQWIGDKSILNKNNNLFPSTVLPGFINEPILITKTKNNQINFLSNVCTHRGNILVKKECKAKKIICNYHGRKFNNDGKFEFMPEFDKVVDFPKKTDDLINFPSFEWNGLFFIGFNPKFKISSILEKIGKRISFLAIDKIKCDHNLSRDYLINANWALYCDNYLEGFHVPFVHPGLNQVLDYNNYETEIYKYFNLQIGYAKKQDQCFNIPKGHKDYGKKIAAYYYWIFPNLMLNIYPWGISINLVCPIEKSKTKVLFRSYVFDKKKLNSGAGGDLDKVEIEDEEIVLEVQKGIESNFYKTGRFSPTKEKGVHHFHLLISEFYNAK